MQTLLKMIADGNGGLTTICVFFGIFALVVLTESLSLVVVTKKSPVALVAGHVIYHIDETVSIPLAATKSPRELRCEVR